jgi:hypothetical protein
VGFTSVSGGIREPGVNHGVSPVVNHAGIAVRNPGNTVGFYHGNEGFRHGFSGRFPASYQRDSRRALESRRFYVHRALRLTHH